MKNRNAVQQMKGTKRDCPQNNNANNELCPILTQSNFPSSFLDTLFIFIFFPFFFAHCCYSYLSFSSLHNARIYIAHHILTRMHK